ncbi:MAG: hypothetical protein Q8P81_03575 [Nanoarchaeota archaeon]|nr:hypothetical protein [Nanoarchaeota archaeon]
MKFKIGQLVKHNFTYKHYGIVIDACFEKFPSWFGHSALPRLEELCIVYWFKTKTKGKIHERNLEGIGKEK